MTDHLLRKGHGWRRALQITCALVSVVGAGSVGGCLNRPIQPNEPRTTTTIVEPFKQSAVDKIDLLLMIDNSRSMADKQQILAAAVPDLVGALVNPKCVDPKGTLPTAQPDTIDAPCPNGLVREFKPIKNIHIGIVTSSLGGHGGNACPVPAPGAACGPETNPSNNDAGHLISRKTECGGELYPTYQNKGFLAWDPDQKLMPAGEKDIGSIKIDMSGNVTTDQAGIVPSLKDLVVGAGQIGCGYEASLEAWYRFLVDPEPYETITVQGSKTVPAGLDKLLLQQRADFLRSSSLLAVIMLTDENDCSVKESSYFYLATNSSALPRARKECLTNPNDACCKSCALAQGNCPDDADCKAKPYLDVNTEDKSNLRCFDQKRRFGIDFLYPIDRYKQGLSSLKVPARDGSMVENPIFSDLNPGVGDDHTIRDSKLVFIAGIVGVPWQDIARTDAAGAPDLTLGFKNYDELSLKENDVSTWDKILGDPANYVPPKDAHMIESVQPRDGLAPATSLDDADPINGHEYTIDGNDDLQYACIFALPSPRDCLAANNGCDCSTPKNDNPLCDATVDTQQVRAKGYPCIRELSTLYALESQGIVASVCPKQLTDRTKADYGYRPAIGAIIDRLKTVLGGQCLPRELTPDKAGQVQCLILEAVHVEGTPTCAASAFRRDLSETHAAAKTAALATPGAANQNWNQFCELIQAGDTTDGISSKAQLDGCQQDSSSAPVEPVSKKLVNGWCYVDPAQNPDSNKDLVASCASTEKHLIRFVGEKAAPLPGSTLFITCSGE
jgi:hypothetical protein